MTVQGRERLREQSFTGKGTAVHAKVLEEAPSARKRSAESNAKDAIRWNRNRRRGQAK